MRRILKFLFLVVLIGSLIVILIQIEWQPWLQTRLLEFEKLGLIGHLLFFILSVLIIPLLIPNGIFNIAAGILFPFPLAVFYVVLAETLGAAIAFKVSRRFLHGHLKDIILHRKIFWMISRAVAHAGWQVVMYSRMIPFFPFKFANYAYGLTHISFWQYAWGTFLGIIPRILIFVYIGYVIGDLSELQDKSHPTNWWLIGIFALLALICLPLMIRKSIKSFQAVMKE